MPTQKLNVQKNTFIYVKNTDTRWERSMVITFKEKRKARRDKRKEEGKESIWWELLDIFLDIAELIGPSIVRFIRSIIKFLEHH
jgi:hypothetical protein